MKIPIRGTVHGLISKTGNLRIPMCVVSSVGKKRDVATDFFRISIPGYRGQHTEKAHSTSSPSFSTSNKKRYRGMEPRGKKNEAR